MYKEYAVGARALLPARVRVVREEHDPLALWPALDIGLVAEDREERARRSRLRWRAPILLCDSNATVP